MLALLILLPIILLGCGAICACILGGRMERLLEAQGGTVYELPLPLAEDEPKPLQAHG